jgi:hypothetical protein
MKRREWFTGLWMNTDNISSPTSFDSNDNSGLKQRFKILEYKKLPSSHGLKNSVRQV